MGENQYMLANLHAFGWRIKGKVTWAIIAGVVSIFGFTLAQSASAYTYQSYEIDDLSVSVSDASLNATSNVTISFSVPYNLTTSSYLYVSLPYLYRYENGSYNSQYLDASSATISSSQLTTSYNYGNYLSFYPKSSISKDTTISLTMTGAKNPASLEGTGTFYVYTSEYTSDNYTYAWGSVSQVYGDPDLTITVYDNNGTTPVANVYVSASYYSYSSSSSYSYDYHYGYTNSSGQLQFAGLTTNRTYDISFWYNGTKATGDTPSSTNLTYNGGDQAASYAFVTPNVSTHWQDEDGNAIANAYWYFYKTDYRDYNTDYVWRSGNTDSTGYLKGAANKDGSYTLYVSDANYNYYSFNFTVTNGVASGLSDPIRKPSPEISGQVVADGTAVSGVYIYAYNSSYSVYKYDTTDSSGNFEIALGESGKYTVQVSNYNLPSGYFAPNTVQVSVTASVAGSPLTFELKAAKKTISGKVVMQADTVAGIAANTPVTNATLYAYQTSNWAYASDTTDSNGEFSFDVIGGTWNIYIYSNTWPADWAYTGESLVATFNDDNTKESATFNIQVVPYNAHITGRIVYPDGNPVGSSDVYIYASGGENNNIWAYGYTNDNGEFDVKVAPGTYKMYAYFYGSSGSDNYSMPNIENQTVESGETANIGTIALVEKTSHIQGKAYISDTGAAVQDVSIYAYKESGSWDYSYTTTDSSGGYDLLVGPGDWVVYLYAWNITTDAGEKVIYTGGALSITVEDGETVAGNDFILRIADSTFNFITQDNDGNNLTDETGWVSAYEDGGGEYGWYSQGCYLTRGNCSIAVASGVAYTVNYYSYNNWYASDDDDTYTFTAIKVDGVETDTITASANTTTDVALVMSENDVTISGEFLDEDGESVKTTGWLYASNGTGGYAYKYINNESSYTINVAAGTWTINFWTYGYGYSSYYKGQGEEITVKSGEQATVNFSVLKNDATVSGTVLGPNGNPVEAASVRISTSYGDEETETEEKYGLIEQTTETNVNGEFTVTLPGGKYYVTASYGDYLDPQPVKVEADSDGSAEGLVLQFLSSESTITGTVTEGGKGIAVNNERALAVGDPVVGAFVYAYSEKGSSLETTTDENGTYNLAVTQDRWVLGAIFTSNNVSYYSNQENVKVDEATETVDLVLQHSMQLPESQLIQFAPTEPAVITVNDPETNKILATINIPANAITTDPDVTEVTVKVTPTLEMAYETGTRPWHIGFDLTATDQNGTPIEVFSGNVTITFTYEQDDIETSNIHEEDLSMGEHTGNAWSNVASVACNKNNDECSATVSHFSVFAILAPSSVLVADDDTDGDENGDEDGEEFNPEVVNTPGNLRVVQRTKNLIKVRWDEVDSAKSYGILVTTGEKEKVFKRLKSKNTKRVVKHLRVGREYNVAVRAVAASGSQSAWSDALSVRTKPVPPKDARVITQTASTVKIRWDEPGFSVTNYIFQVVNAATGDVVEKGTSKKPMAVISGLESDTTYIFSVKAHVDKHNTSSFSKAITFTTENR